MNSSTNFPLAYAPMRTRLLNGLTLISAALMLLTFGMALFYAGTDTTQGNVQRIFYMHVGSFGAAFVAFGTTVAGGALYLITRNLRWDKLALAGVQVGLPLSTITLITGAIWARPTWNAFWVRDPRLDAMLVMWAVYAAYLILRGAVHQPDQRARFAAIYGILAMVSVIYVTVVIRIRPDTLHPINIAPEVSTYITAEGASKGNFSVTTDQRIGVTMGISSLAWCVLAGVMIWHLVRVANLNEQVAILRMRLAEREAS